MEHFSNTGVIQMSKRLTKKEKAEEERKKFRRHLDEASEIVSKWPKWKQDAFKLTKQTSLT